MQFNITLKLLLTLAIISFIAISGLFLQYNWNIASLHLFIKSYGMMSSVIFICLYVAATLSLLPVAFMAFIGGYIFGFTHGLLVNIIGSSLGAISAFLIGRYLARDWVYHRLGSKTQDLISGVEKMGWKFVAMFRLTPLVPFDVLNFAVGVTSINVGQYLWSSVVFMLPGMITYTYLGKVGLDLIIGQPRFLFLKGILGLIILASLAYTIPKTIAIIRNKAMTELS